MLESLPISAQRQITQLLHDAQRIAGQALAGFALGDLINQAMNAQPVRAKGEKGWLMASHLASDEAKCVVG